MYRPTGLVDFSITFCFGLAAIYRMYFVFFILWLAFSFVANKLAKYYFQSFSYPEYTTLPNDLTGAILVTCVQLLCCSSLLVSLLTKLSNRAALNHKTEKNEQASLGILFMVAIPHMFGALATNYYSMTLVPAAATHFVKVTEPIVIAAISWLIVGVTISLPQLLLLVLVLIGAAGGTWDPHSTFLTGEPGLQLALLSNLLYAARNVTIKHLLGRGILYDAATMGKVSLIGTIMLLPIVCMSIVTHQYNAVALVMLGGSALYYISTCVILQRITVLGCTCKFGKSVDSDCFALYVWPILLFVTYLCCCVLSCLTFVYQEYSSCFSKESMFN